MKRVLLIFLINAFLSFPIAATNIDVDWEKILSSFWGPLEKNLQRLLGPNGSLNSKIPIIKENDNEVPIIEEMGVASSVLYELFNNVPDDLSHIYEMQENEKELFIHQLKNFNYEEPPTEVSSSLAASIAFWEHLFIRILSNKIKLDYSAELFAKLYRYLSTVLSLQNIDKLAFMLIKERLHRFLSDEYIPINTSNYFRGIRQVQNEYGTNSLIRIILETRPGGPYGDTHKIIISYYDYLVKDIKEAMRISDTPIIIDIMNAYLKFLIAVVDSWLKTHIDSNPEFIREQLGEELYISFVKKFKRSQRMKIKPKKKNNQDIKIDFNNFSTSSLLNDISENNSIIEELISHMEKYPEDFSTLGLTIALYDHSGPDDKRGLIDDLKVKLKKGGFSIDKLKDPILPTVEKTVLVNKKNKKNKKKKPKPNTKTNNIRNNYRDIRYTSKKGVVDYFPYKGKLETGSYKPTISPKTNPDQKKRYKLRYAPPPQTDGQLQDGEISYRWGDKDYVPSDELTELFNDLSEIFDETINDYFVTVKDLSDILSALLGKKNIKPDYYEKLIKRYQIALTDLGNIYGLDWSAKINEKLRDLKSGKDPLKKWKIKDRVKFEFPQEKKYLITPITRFHNFDRSELTYFYELLNSIENKHAIAGYDENIENSWLRLKQNHGDQYLAEMIEIAHRYQYEALINDHFQVQKVVARFIFALFDVFKISHGKLPETFPHVVLNREVIAWWQGYFAQLKITNDLEHLLFKGYLNNNSPN